MDTKKDTQNQFNGLSALLTGFSIDKIAPQINVNENTINKPYLNEWQTKVASETGDADLTNNILAMYAELVGDSDVLSPQQKQSIGEQMLAVSEFEMPCRQLIFLWYMGAWPKVMSGEPPTNGSTSFEILSTDSYSAGLVWQVMQAHPMGDSNLRYGYWGTEPVSLDQYTGNVVQNPRNS